MAGRKPADQEFLEYVVKSLVDEPDKVEVERKVDGMGVLLTLDIDPEDKGKVVGKSGQTARSIRTLLRVVGAKNNARVNLKINEPEGGRKFAPRPSEETSAKEETNAGVDDLKL